MKIALTALIPVWIFAWMAAGEALVRWTTNDRNRDAWWSTPLGAALAVPGMFAMAGGVVWVASMWVGQ